jgi:hypothetical protein
VAYFETIGFQNRENNERCGLTRFSELHL